MAFSTRIGRLIDGLAGAYWPRASLSGAALLAAVMGSLGPASAGQFAISPALSKPVFLSEGMPAKPTKAWAAFCRAAPSECTVDVTEPTAFTLTEAAWETIVAVNKQVNRSVKAVTDLDYWGVGDRWDYPVDGYGDCEDIQLEKRKLLVEKGFPARALRIAMVINPENEGHAVLVARTDRGDFVLDNRIEAVLPWYETGYVWVKREGDDAERWVSLGGVRGPMETAGQ